MAALLGGLIAGVPLAGADPPAPTITGTTPPSPSNVDTPIVNGTADAGSLVTVYADACPEGVVLGSGTADLTTGEFHISLALPVTHNTTTMLYVTATNPTVCSNGWPYEEDSTPPPPPDINGHPDPVTNQTSAHFSFTDVETVTYRCQLERDGVVVEAYGDCSAGSKDYANLSDGSYTFEVIATDVAGNDSSLATFPWTIDTSAPSVTITEAPPRLTNVSSATFRFSSSTATSFKCALDGGASAPCQNPQQYQSVTNGTHTFRVQGTTPAGNSDEAEYTWRVDTVPPVTTITGRPPSPSHSTTATFAFASSEAGSTFVCSLNSGGFSPCASPETYSGLGDGTYTFHAQAVDAAGNADPSGASYTWSISGVGPPTRDFKPPSNVSHLRKNVGYGRLQLRWTKPVDPDFDHVGVYVSTSPKTAPRTLVYSGKGRSYLDRHFKNAQYYRYLIVSYDHLKNASGGARALVQPSALLLSPRNGSVVHRAPTFRWAAIPGARYYNIQIYTRGEKVLSTWPAKARQVLTSRWQYKGRRYELRRGLYVWWVWPGFGPRSRGNYGHLLGQGTFKVR
jgi:hypothetical protein